MTLEFAAASFLKWEKRCRLVLWERSPRAYYAGEPDVMGISDSDYMLEIEIKRSAADFRKNMQKRHIENRFCTEETIRSLYASKAPRQFWFLMPPKLAESLQADIPEWAGLMRPTDSCHGVVVMKKAPTNRESLKLNEAEIARLMHCAGAQIMALMRANAYLHERKHDPTDPHWMDDFHVNERRWYPDREPYVNFQI